MSKVALVKGKDRYKNIFQAISLIGEDIKPGKRILIKPNFVSTTHQSSATHVDAVKAIIDFLRKKTDAQIIVGEGSAVSSTFEGYKNYGYYQLISRYRDVELKDLNQDDFESFMLYDRKMKPHVFRISKTVLDSDFRISLALLKTHDSVMVTLSLKNITVGSLIRDSRIKHYTRKITSPFRKIEGILPKSVRARISYQTLSSITGTRFLRRNDKARIHQGYANTHLFIYQLAQIIPPHLSVIDGFQGMEGNGPVHGRLLDSHTAIVSTDFLSADIVATRLMGFDEDDIGYLHYCKEAKLGEGDLNRITTLGTSPEKCRYSFRPHSTHRRQLRWHVPGLNVTEIKAEPLFTNPA